MMDKEEEKNKSQKNLKKQDKEISNITYFTLNICRILILLGSDPQPNISDEARLILKYIKNEFLKSESISETINNEYSKSIH
jgi:hypothetical protein